MSRQNLERLISAYGWKAVQVLIAGAVTVGAYFLDQRMTQAEVRQRLDLYAGRITVLEETDKLQARAERAEGEWRGRMVERMDALISRLDRIERKIDGGSK